MNFHSIFEVINDIKQGKIVIMLDDERENEGDMIVAAEFATPKNIAFMMKYGCGIICTPISQEIAKKFELALLPRRFCDDIHQCFNTVSIDAKSVKSGVSAIDRAKTIQKLVTENVTASDLKTPGHVFPLIANSNGVLERPGHTEASVDLMKLAGLQPAAALVEVMNEGKDKLATNEELLLFAHSHHLKISTIRALIEFRKNLA